MRLPTDEDYKWAVQDMISDDDRKLLTEYLGECWHEPASNFPRHCCKCGQVIPKDTQTGNIRRTFTTRNDFEAVLSKILENGEWREFERYAFDIHLDILGPKEEFNRWLFTPARFCKLVEEWLRGKG